MSLIIYKIFAAFLIFMTSLMTVIYPLKQKHFGHVREPMALGEALANGIFLGAALFHLLPDAIHLLHQAIAIEYPIAELICASGFIFLLFLERLSLAFTGCPNQKTIPYILTITLIIHSLIEGTALGIGSTFSEAVLIFIAIIAHKGSESFALCMTLLRHDYPFRRILFIVIFFALMTPLGILLGATINALTVIQQGKLIAGCFSAFAAGTFLYIATLHHAHFHEHKGEAQGIYEFLSLVFGTAVMAVLAVWA